MVHDLEIPCDALEAGAPVAEDEGASSPVRGASVPLPIQIELRASPEGERVAWLVVAERGARANLLGAEGAAREIEKHFERGHRVRAWVPASELKPRRGGNQSGLLGPLSSASASALKAERDLDAALGGESGLGTSRPMPLDRTVCMFIPGIEGARTSARVARETPVLRGHVGRHVWAEVTTDAPLELLVPPTGDRARIVRVAGLTPVKEGQLCPKVMLDAWIPKGAILDTG
jgi:hypothetical protein